MLVYVKRSALGSVMFQGPLTSTLERGDSVVSSEITAAASTADESCLTRCDSATKSLKLRRRMDDAAAKSEPDDTPDKKEDVELKSGPRGDSPTLLAAPSEIDPFAGAFIKGPGGVGLLFFHLIHKCLLTDCGYEWLMDQILMWTCPWMCQRAL